MAIAGVAKLARGVVLTNGQTDHPPLWIDRQRNLGDETPPFLPAVPEQTECPKCRAGHFNSGEFGGIS
jgi:hypothetical protein